MSKQKTLIIDNAGFDIEAMGKLSEKEFIDLHKDNADINYGKTAEQMNTWLKDAYKAVKGKATQPAKEKEESAEKAGEKK